MAGRFTIPALAPPGETLRYWVDPTGVVRDLNGATGVSVGRAERGLGMASVELAFDKLPFVEGAIARHANVQPITLEIPLYVEGATAAALENVVDGVHRWFATANERLRRPGYYRVKRRDGTFRQRACYFVGGLEGDLSDERAGELQQELDVILRAADPFAADIEDTVLSYVAADLPTVIVIGGGHVPSYPIWTIEGPIANLTVANATTGKAWGVDYDLVLGDQLIVDTRPDFQRSSYQVRDGLGANKFANLTSDQELWWLEPAANNITISATGTTGDTAIELRYVKRYHGLMR